MNSYCYLKFQYEGGLTKFDKKNGDSIGTTFISELIENRLSRTFSSANNYNQITLTNQIVQQNNTSFHTSAVAMVRNYELRLEHFEHQCY